MSSRSLKDSVVDRLHAAITALAGGAALTRDEVAALVEIPPDQKLGDFAFPCFRLAKALKKAPPLIAGELAAKVGGSDVKQVGPYVNFFMDYGAIAAEAIQSALSGELFRVKPSGALPKTMIEYSQPNTHKAFHVGHMRNVALGDALVRMNRHMGYEVVAANYIGDDGAHIAKCLWYLTKFKKGEKPVGDKGEWLGGLYTAATQKVDDAGEAEKAAFQKEISVVQQKLEAKDPELTKLWLETKEWSMESFREIYGWLGVKFDHYFFESEVTDEARAIVAEGLKKGIFVNSQGAVGADLEADNLGFMLLLKSDGTTLYSTRDLALARRKFEDWGVGRSIYVVASEQDLHFRQVFKALEKMGFEQVKNCHHLSYGLVVLPEGKMSSRVGNVIYFSELREKLTRHIRDIAFKELDVSEMSEAEQAETAKRIAIAAIKYGMIASDPKKNIVFDMPQWLALNGDTGPYLQYSFVRMRSILRKAGHVELAAANALKPGAVAYGKVFAGLDEKGLLKRALNLNDAVARGVRDQSPAPLASYLFDFCQDFNSFYGKTSILKQEDPAVRDAYLQLVAACAAALEKGCGLLGIEMPSRM